MKKFTRYSLIGAGVLGFLILAPLLIFYVSGTTYKFDGTGASSTGILDVKSNPTGAQVFIDDKPHSTTPAIARFLNQGEYIVKVSKDGYYDWVKRLPIESGQVTYAQDGVTELQLIKKSQPFVITPSGVSSFTLVGDEVWFAKGKSLVHASINDPAKQTELPLNFSPAGMQLLRDKTYLFVYTNNQNLLVNTQTLALTTLPFGFNPDEAIVVDDNLLVKIGQTLHSYNLTSKADTILRNNVTAFTMLGSTMYFANDSGTISSGVWTNSTISDEQPLIKNTNLPPGEAQLIITDHKELFLKDSQKTLYRVNQTLENVAGQVEKTHLDLKTNELTIRTSSEIGFYNFLTNQFQLLTRSTQPLNDFVIRSSIGYGFIANSSGLEIVEIDSRDHQNRYQILSGPVWQVTLTDNQKTALALLDGSLIMIDLRN
jgi:hypothetical protein